MGPATTSIVGVKSGSVGKFPTLGAIGTNRRACWRTSWEYLLQPLHAVLSPRLVASVSVRLVSMTFAIDDAWHE
jgi:hypothetical protein